MQTFASVFERQHAALIVAEVSVLAEQLLAGSGVMSFDEYRRIVGKIEGLRLALDLHAEARAGAEKQERGG